MAIYHCSIKIISRGKGKSAVAAAAYRSGETITNEYDGLTHDYTRKAGIVHTEILLPQNAPREYADRSTLWNAVEKSERYKTAQLAREIEIALPAELTREQNISLAREFVKQNFVEHGMCADICIHDKQDGNYSGTVSQNFTISPKPLTASMLTVTGTYTYTGSAQTPTVTVTDGSTLMLNTHYNNVSATNNINAGTTASVSVTGIGNYSGTVSKNFTISPKPLTASMLTVTGTYTYTGSAQTPTVTVTDGSTLMLNTHYNNVSATNNINAGTTASVSVTGIGNYSGTVSKNFTISPKPLTASMLTVTGTYTYTGTAQTPTVTVTDVSALTLNTHYNNVTATNNINAGTTASVSVTGINNYTGTVSKNFTISPKPLTASMLTVTGTYTYTGSAQTPTVTVTDGSTLMLNTHYNNVTATNNINAGTTASVSVTGINNYTGTVSKNFTISPKPLTASMLTVTGTYTYTGTAQTPTVAVTDGSALMLNTHYNNVTATNITRHLRDKGYPNPNAYVNAKDPEHHARSDYWKAPHDWHPTSIKTMLHNPTYLGKIVSGRRRTRSFKDKQIIFMPEDDWIVVENTHEPTISQQTWDLAHEKLKVRKRCDNHGAIQMFAGLVKCADCGYSLAYTKSGGKKNYQCSQYNVKGKAYCTSHYIRYDELYDVVLHDIRRRAKAAAGMDKQMLKTLKREASGLLDKKLKQAEKEFKAIDARITELDAVIGRLYEDSVLNRISRDRFDSLLQKYEDEQTELKKKHIEVQKELAEQQKHQSESNQFMEMISEYKDITSLNASLLNELIHSIEVGAIEMVDGVKHRSIRIKYRQFCYVEIFSEDELFAGFKALQELEAAV